MFLEKRSLRPISCSRSGRRLSSPSHPTAGASRSHCMPPWPMRVRSCRATSTSSIRALGTKGVTNGPWCDRAAAWAPKARTLKIPLGPGHAGTSLALHSAGERRRTATRGDTSGLRRVGRLVQRGWALVGAHSRPRLLRPGLDRAGGERRGSAREPGRPPPRRGTTASLPARAGTKDGSPAWTSRHAPRPPSMSRPGSSTDSRSHPTECTPA